MQMQGKNREAQEDIDRQHQGDHETIQDMTENQSVWHLKTKTGTLLHGGRLYLYIEVRKNRRHQVNRRRPRRGGRKTVVSDIKTM